MKCDEKALQCYKNAGEKIKGQFTLEVMDKSLNSKTITITIP